MRTFAKRMLQAIVAAPTVSVAILATSCSATPGSTSTVTPKGPSYVQFVGDLEKNGIGVHAFLENQCGTLDCHGQVGRPFRLYSVNGLRLPNDAGLVSGAGNESAAEFLENYLSAISIEPDTMSRVVAGTDPPTQLLLVKKPTGLEKHKGGVRIVQGSPLDICLTGWLEDPSKPGSFSADACNKAAAFP